MASPETQWQYGRGMSKIIVALHSTRTLSSFVAGLRYEDLQEEVVEHAKEFFLDRAASQHPEPQGDRGESPEILHLRERASSGRRWDLCAGFSPPAMLDGQEPVMAPIPEVGEHNEKILAELGYEDV
jgi:crotonobetainyl-CoA:carnitine CoA-transferase CaiB-like acyl-CoA transferase